jgi:sugar phosphate isomerase/epimerase
MTRVNTAINKFSFSTSWNSLKETDGAKILQSIRDLGFMNVELNFQFDRKKLKGVVDFLKTSDMRVTGVHNYCPTPDDVPLPKALPDCYSLAATDEVERKKAVACTRESIVTSRMLGGTYVVVHSGRVTMEMRMRDLINLAKEGKMGTSEFDKIKHAMIAERSEKVKEHFDALATSYSELMPDAVNEGIILGLENRFYVPELPSPDEIEKLLGYFRKQNLRYWHDVGHAVIQESLGFYHPGEYIGRFHHDLFGVHLHDVLNYRDHAMPCTGEVPFIELESFIGEDVVKVIEVHGHQSKDAILAGFEKLCTIF